MQLLTCTHMHTACPAPPLLPSNKVTRGMRMRRALGAPYLLTGVFAYPYLRTAAVLISTHSLSLSKRWYTSVARDSSLSQTWRRKRPVGNAGQRAMKSSSTHAALSRWRLLMDAPHTCERSRCGWPAKNPRSLPQRQHARDTLMPQQTRTSNGTCGA